MVFAINNEYKKIIYCLNLNQMTDLIVTVRTITVRLYQIMEKPTGAPHPHPRKNLLEKCLNQYGLSNHVKLIALKSVIRFGLKIPFFFILL